MIRFYLIAVALFFVGALIWVCARWLLYVAGLGLLFAVLYVILGRFAIALCTGIVVVGFIGELIDAYYFAPRRISREAAKLLESWRAERRC